MNFIFLWKITTALGISSMIFQFLKALFSPRLWLYTLLYSSEKRFLKLFLSKCSAFTALLEKHDYSWEVAPERNVFGHISFRQQICLHIKAATWPIAQLTSTQLMAGLNPHTWERVSWKWLLRASFVFLRTNSTYSLDIL